MIANIQRKRSRSRTRFRSRRESKVVPEVKLSTFEVFVRKILTCRRQFALSWVVQPAVQSSGCTSQDGVNLTC